MANSLSVGRMGTASSSPVTRAAAAQAAFSEASAPSAAQWVCILHRAHRGPHARFSIRRAGFEVYWPRLVVRRPKQDDILQPLFPGYLFARVRRSQDWASLCSCDDVLDVLGVREFGRPSLVPTDFVEELLSEGGGFDLPINRNVEDAPELIPGGPITLTGSALGGLQGLLVADGGKGRVEVLLSLLGRSIAVSAPRQHVRQA